MAYVRALYSLLVAFAIAGTVSCTGIGTNEPSLSAVSALPKPSLPPWIASISPTRTAQSLAQIRVIFAKPVTPVEALSGEGPRAVLDRVSIEPKLAGHFVVLTPRMIGFVAERALPVGTRVRVTLAAGLRDLAGDTLQQDLAWTFETQALNFSSLPQLTAGDDEATPAPVDLRPKTPSHRQCRGGRRVVGRSCDDRWHRRHQVRRDGGPGSDAVARSQATTRKNFTIRRSTFGSTICARRASCGGARPTSCNRAGVEPLYGNLATARRFLGSVRTYDALAIVPTPVPSPNGGGRFADGDPAIAFSNPLDPNSIAKRGEHLAGAGGGEDADERFGSIEHDRHRPLRPRSRQDVRRNGRRERERRIRSNARARTARDDSYLGFRAGRVGAQRLATQRDSGRRAGRPELLRNESYRETRIAKATLR